jgi:hypothetical protein
MGVGIGMIMSPTNTDALNAAPPKDRGEASGVIQTLRQVGGSVGLALMGTVVSSVQTDHIDAFIASNPSQAAAVQQAAAGSSSGSAEAQAGVSPTVINAVHDALTAATSSSYYVAAGVMAFAGVVAVLILRHVRATDAPAPDHPATIPAPRGVHVRTSHA